MTTIVDGNLGIFTTGNVTANNFFGNIAGNALSVPGANTQVLFNDSGVLGAATGLTYNKIDDVVGVSGDLVPAANGTGSLGNASSQWKDMWISGNTIYMQNIPLTMAGASNLQVNGSNVLTVSPSGQLSAATISAGSITSNLLTISQDAAIAGNLTVNGNITANGNINVISGNAGQFFGNVITGANALYAGIPVGYAVVQQTVLQLATNYNGYTQLNAQNLNTGSQASFDFVATADNGNDVFRYIDMGIASSTWDGTSPESLGNAVSPNDGYLYVDSGNLVVGTNTSGKVLKINVGAPDNTGAVAQFNLPNTLSTSATTGALTVVGGIGATSNITAGGNITAGNITTVGNITAGNIIGTIIGSVSNANHATYADNVLLAAQPNITSLGTLTALTVTGNVAAGNVSATDVTGTTLGGSLTTAAQPNITSLGVLSSLSVTGNLGAGNVNTTGVINAGSLGGLAGTGVGATGSWGISVTGSASTITTAAQPNITSVGTLTSLAVSGNITAGNVTATTFSGNFVGNFASPGANTQVIFNDGGYDNASVGMTFNKTTSLFSVAGNIVGANLTTAGNVTGAYIIGDGGSLSNITGANVTGVVANANYAAYAGNITIANQPNITGLGTLTALTVTGNVEAGNMYANSGTIGAAALTATSVTATTLGGSLTTAAQPNITSVGSLTSLTVTGNIGAGNVTATTFTGNLVGNVTGNISGNLSAPGANTQVIFNDGGIANATNGMTFDKTSNTLTVAGNTSVGNLTTVGNITGARIIGDGGSLSNITGANVTGVVANANYAAYAGNITIANQPNITTLGTLTALTVTGNASVGNLQTAAIVATGLANVNSLTVVTTTSLGGNVTLNGSLGMGTGNITAGNLSISGNVSIAGNITQVNGNSGQFFGNTTTGLGALYAGLPIGYTVVPTSVFQAATNLNDYTQVNQQNINSGAKASADYVVTADNGTDTSYFLDLGLTSSGWDGTQTNSLGNALAPNDGYGYVKNGNFVIGTASSGKTVKVLSGASDATGIVATFNAPGTGSTNTTSGSLVLAGGLGMTGNLNAGNVTATTITGNLVGNVSGNISGNLSAPGANTEVLFNDAGTANASIGMTFNKSSNLFTVGGNISGANLVTGGLVAATGNVSGGNITTAGVVAATGNVSGGNITTGAQVVATGNITGGNINTGGVVSATGNITGANVTSNGLTQTNTLNVTANANVGNIGSSGVAIVTGNITGGNINTAGQVVASANVSGANIVTAGNVYATTALVANAVTGNGSGVTITATGTNQNVTLAPSGTGVVSASSARITNVAAPSADTDASNKAYVDSVAQGLSVKTSCIAATTAALPSYSYNNGASGIGATATALANGVLVVDGHTTQLGDRILVKNESGGLGVVNGIYVVTTAGAAGAAFVLTRAVDFDAPSEIPSAFTFIAQGTVNADTGWVCTTNPPIVIGTTTISFSQFSGAGAYSAGSGLTLTGGVFSVNVDGTTTAIVSGNVAIPTGATLTNPNITAATGTSIVLSGNANAANLNVTSTVTASTLVSNVAAGTAPLTVTSTTRVSNLNVSHANVSDFGAVTTQTTGVFFPTFVSSSSTGNLALASNSALSFNAATGALTSTLLGGTLSTAAQPNVTSVGTLTSLAVTGNASAGNVSTLGAVSATGNISGGNITTGGLVLATGNVSGGNITTGGIVNASGNLVSAANINGVNFNGSGNAVLTGNISAGNAAITANLGVSNISATGNVSVTGNIQSTGGYIIGDGGFLSNLTVAGGTAIVNGTSNVSIPAPSGNINFNIGGTAAGKLTATSVSLGVGAGAAGTFATAIGSGAGGVTQGSQATAIGYNAGSSGQGASAVAIGALAGQTNQTAGSIAINASGSALNPTGAGLFINPVRSDSGNVTSPMFYNSSTNELTYSTAMSLSGNVIAGNVYANSGTIRATTLTGTLSTAAQTNITSVGTLTSLAVTGNITSGNVSGTTGAFTTVTGDGSGLTALNATNISSGTLAQVRLANSSLTVNGTAISLGGSGTVTANAQTLTGTSLNATVVGSSLTSVGTLTSLGVTGALTTTQITTGTSATAGNITGTWTLTAGSTLEATYADMAERYTSDEKYPAGTVLMIGGTAETTIATVAGKTRIAGIVSSEPAYILNSTLKDSVVIALIGRVPCRVVGTIEKGDLLTISDIPGVATVAVNPECGTIIARALESYNSTEVGVIEVKVDKG